MNRALSIPLILLALATAPRAHNPITGGEGGWINVPGGGGGTIPMMVVRGFTLQNELYFLLADPATPSICCASASLVAQWATGIEAFSGPETLEFKYNSRVNGVVGEVSVKVDCKNMTPQECAAKLARLVIATQAEFKPVSTQ